MTTIACKYSKISDDIGGMSIDGIIYRDAHIPKKVIVFGNFGDETGITITVPWYGETSNSLPCAIVYDTNVNVDDIISITFDQINDLDLYWGEGSVLTSGNTDGTTLSCIV